MNYFFEAALALHTLAIIVLAYIAVAQNRVIDRMSRSLYEKVSSYDLGRANERHWKLRREFDTVVEHLQLKITEEPASIVVQDLEQP